jgi:DNA-binding winged helix-turn-helix (wHTH) protein
VPLGIPDVLQLEGCTVDLERRLVRRSSDGSTVALTGKETELLLHLVTHTGRDVSREELLEEVWGYSADMVTRTVDNTVRRLRSKVEEEAREPRHIITVFGVGYRFAPLRGEAAASAPNGVVALVFVAGAGGLEEGPGFVAHADAEGTLVAFSTAEQALAFARTIPGRSCGLHVGEPDVIRHPVSGAVEYAGAAADLCVAVGNAAHPGQLLASGEAWLAMGRVGTQVDLGFHRLPGVDGPQRLVQLGAGAFPQPRTVDARRTNLPAQHTSFVGRATGLAEVMAALSRGARLVSITGTGGAGKTRLAIEAARDLIDVYSADGGGVWFVDLTWARSLDDVIRAVATALDIPLIGDELGPVAARHIGHAVRAWGNELVVLDNAEQVVEGVCAAVSAWLDLAPACRFLVTSRTPLGLDAEHVHHIASLDTGACVALFVDRARAVRPHLQLHAPDLQAIEAIAAQLDHLPLAMELAAARVLVLPPRSLL